MRRHAKASSAAATRRRGLRALVIVTALTVLALASTAAPAVAVKTHFFAGDVGSGELVAPQGLAVAGDGSLYVADPAAGNVRRYDAAGNPSDFDALGSNVLPVNPLAIAVDTSGGPKDGTLYVATSMEGANEVWAFDSEGEPVNFTEGDVLGNKLRGDTENSLSVPLGIAVGPEGSLIVPQEQRTFLFAGSGARITRIAENTMVPGNPPPANPGLGAAVDSSGTVFGSDGSFGSFGGQLAAYAPTSMPYSGSTSWTQDVPGVANLHGLAVDTVNDDLYVNRNGFVSQYESAAEGLGEIGTFGEGDLPEGSNSVAIDRSGGPTDGDVYLISGAKVARFGPTVTVPSAATETIGDVAFGLEADLRGTVDPDGIELTQCRFEYGTDPSYGNSVPCEETPAEIGSGSGAVAVRASVPGLAVGDYHFRLIAANTNGPSRGADQDFSIIEDPAVEAQSAEPALTEARLRATIDPGNAVTEYRFEYGLTAAYGKATPFETIPAGTAPVELTASSFGLSPGVTYHYRVVATNAAGSAAGPDETFTTETKAPESCPNAAIRQAQQVTWLGECRAYEMVSPPDKEGIDVFSGHTVSTAAGDEVGFVSVGAFAGSPSRANVVTYLTRRDSQAWTTEAVDPPDELEWARLYRISWGFSPDLSKTLQASSYALTPGAVAGGSNLYLRDNATGERTLVASEEGEDLHREFAGVFSSPVVGGTEDWRSVVFQLGESGLLAEGALPQQANIYRYDGEDLEIVNRLPDGTPTPAQIPEDVLNPVSTDGSRVFFQQFDGNVGGESALYLRDGDQTVPISASQRSGDEGVVKNGQLQGATADGSVVYFTSQASLLDGVENFGQPTLYRYNVDTGVLTNLTPFDAGGYGVARVVAMNKDGTYLYFTASASLVDGVEPSSFFATNIYVWHDGEIRYLGKTVEGPEESQRLDGVSISPDGRSFAFTSYSPITPESQPRPGCETVVREPACLDLFVYDFGADELSCVQCHNPDGGGISLPQTQAQRESAPPPRAVFNDGAVLFETPRSLLSRDVNGRGDPYTWRDGRLIMLTSGTSRFDTQVVAASADRSSVFITTPDQLVRQDVDRAADLYAVRIGGGLAGQEPPGAPPGCEGEACRGAIGPTPLPTGIGSTPAANDGHTLPRCPRLHRRAKAAAGRVAKLRRTSSRAKGSAARELQKAAIRERKRSKRTTAKMRNCGGQHR